MKRFFYLSLILIGFSSCSGQPELGKFGSMFGEVKKVKVSQYDCDFKFGEAIPGELKGVEISEYDKEGNLISSFTYDSDGDCEYGQRIEWDGDGLVPSRSEIYGWKSDVKPEAVEEQISHDGGNYTFKRVESDGETETYTVNIQQEGLYRKFTSPTGAVSELWYNEDGQIRLEKYYDDEWDAEQVIKYKNGMLMSVEGHHQEVGFSWEYEYTEFDSKGNWLTRIKKDDDDYTIEKCEITYW